MQNNVEIIQINISGEDKPGMTSSLTEILARYDAFILDIGQANIHQSLTLGILFKTTSDKSGNIMKELLFKASELGVMIRFTPISEQNYDNWVGRQGKNRYIITLLGRTVTARHIAEVTRVVAQHGLNIDAIKRLTGRIPLSEDDRAAKSCIELSVRGSLTDEERAAYVDSYLTEGDFDDSGSIKIFPVAKSTELLFLNDTDWKLFAAATGARYSDLETVEGLVKTAEAYYNWTDAQTDTPNDGKALFGRDAIANYMLIGAKELGETIFDVKDGKMTMGMSEDVARKLWDNYYVPYIKGWAAASGRFRSDDIKIGSILAYIGSNSSATYFPTQVMLSDTESHSIALKVLPAPHFADGEKFAVQQGAGMAVAKTTDAEEAASVVFLKWFTQPENNIAFAVGSGYLPVTYAANDMDAIHSSGLALTGNMENVLTEAVEAVNTNEMYTTKAFEGGTDARSKLGYSMIDLATADRATVEERLAAGESAEEAEAGFLTDEYFEAWYQSLCDALSQYEG